MTHCCSQCSFTAQFQSALTMHHQLHHEAPPGDDFPASKDKSNTIPRSSFEQPLPAKHLGGFRLAGRTTSATKLFDKLRAKICKSKQALFIHPEESLSGVQNINLMKNDLSVPSECTSKGLKLDSPLSRSAALINSLHPAMESRIETYGCHLCTFEADRITVLDRHLLNDHKIGLENLLKLVMAKTKDGVSEEKSLELEMLDIRHPYYRPQDDTLEEGEFIIETVSPKIKILRHAATNTDLKWNDIPDLKANCRIITKELEKLIKYPIERSDKDKFLTKMQNLNECMCKFVDSSNAIKKVLKKEYDSKHSVRGHLSNIEEPIFNIGLEEQDSPRAWERAHSENLERNRHGRGEHYRDDNMNLASESFYF